jgi:hypothetical protein
MLQAIGSVVMGFCAVALFWATIRMGNPRAVPVKVKIVNKNM